MLNVVELFLIGDPVDLVVALEQPGLEVKKLTRGTLGGKLSFFYKFNAAHACILWAKSCQYILW